MKEDNISQLGDYDAPFCEQQYKDGSCYISLLKFKSFDQYIPQTASHYRHLLSCGTITTTSTLRPAFPSGGRKHLQTIFTIENLIKILAASTCMTDFFCKSMAASNFCDHTKSAFTGLTQRKLNKVRGSTS